MDELKKYLHDKHDELDFDVPSGNVLKRIQASTVKKKKAGVFTIVMRTAAAACVAGLIFWGGKQLFTTETKKTGTDIVNTAVQPAKTEIAVNTIKEDTIKPAEAITTSIIKKKVSSTVIQKQPPNEQQLLQSFENNYNKLVSLQMNAIRQTPVYTTSADYFNDFKTALNRTTVDETSIKNKIKTDGLNEELLEQLIKIYQNRINLLKALQHEIIRVNNKVKENLTPSDTIIASYIKI